MTFASRLGIGARIAAAVALMAATAIAVAGLAALRGHHAGVAERDRAARRAI